MPRYFITPSNSVVGLLLALFLGRDGQKIHTVCPRCMSRGNAKVLCFVGPRKNKEIAANCWKINPKITLRRSFHCPAPQSDRFYAPGLETKAALTHHVVEALWCKLSWHFLYCFFKHCEGLLWMKQIKKEKVGDVCIRKWRETGVGVTSHSSPAARGPDTVNTQRGIGGRWEAGSYRV